MLVKHCYKQKCVCVWRKVTTNFRYPFPFEQRSLLFSSNITSVWIALWKRVWNKSLFLCWSKFNCHQTFVSFLYQQHYSTVYSVRSEHKTIKIMICTYWWWLGVTGEREIEQQKRLARDGSVQYVVSRKTQKYSDTRHCVKSVWASVWWSSSTLGQRHRRGPSIQDSGHVTSAAMLEICVFRKICRPSQFRELGCRNAAFSESWNTAALLQSEMCGAEWVVMGVDCEWGVCKCRTSALLKLAVTLLQMSHRSACSYTQHCLKLPACYSTSVTTTLHNTTLHNTSIYTTTLYTT